MKYKVITTEVNLHAASIPDYPLPTFQTARLKTVYYRRFGIKRVVAKYVFFTYMKTIPGAHSLLQAATRYLEDEYEYVETYLRVK